MMLVIAFLLVALFAGGITAYYAPYCRNMVSISRLYDGNMNPPPGILSTESLTHFFAYSPTLYLHIINIIIRGSIADKKC